MPWTANDLKQWVNEAEPATNFLLGANKIRAALVGAPGCGKTTFLGSAITEDEPGLVLDVDLGASAIAGRAGVHVIQIVSDGLLRIMPEGDNVWIHKEPGKGLQLLKDLLITAVKSGKYKTIAVDGETGLMKLAQSCIPVAKSSRGADDTRGWYREYLNLHATLLTISENHSGHFFWTCHAKGRFETVQGESVQTGLEPAIMGQAFTLVPASMDEVYYITRKGKDVTVYTEHPSFDMLKSRYKLPAKLEPGTFQTVKREIEAKCQKLGLRKED